MSDPLTPKQRQIVDYMRGNGCVLDAEGRVSLKRRGVWSEKGISMVVSGLAGKGLAYHDHLSSVVRLTEEGRRV